MSILISAALASSLSNADGQISDEIVYLPEGRHEITATVDGKPKTITVNVPKERGGRSPHPCRSCWMSEIPESKYLNHLAKHLCPQVVSAVRMLHDVFCRLFPISHARDCQTVAVFQEQWSKAVVKALLNRSRESPEILEA